MVRKLTGLPFRVPASKRPMSRHLPLYRYFCVLPPQSVSAYWSMMSLLAEVSVVEKRGVRPISRYPGNGAEVAPRQCSPGACMSISRTRPGKK